MNVEEFIVKDIKEQVTYLASLEDDLLEDYLKQIKNKNSRLSRQLIARLNTTKQEKSILGESIGGTLKNSDMSITLIDLDSIKPNPNQPRKFFDLQELVKLSEEIKITKKIIQPIKLNHSPEGSYEIVYGERRWRAYLLLREESPLEYKTIPSLIEYNMSSHKMQTEAIIENIARTDMSLVETAKSYKFLIDQGYLQKEIVDKSQNKSKSAVSRLIQISTLDNVVLDKIEEYKINSSNILEPLTKKDNTTKTFILTLEQQLELLELMKEGAKLKRIQDQIKLWTELPLNNQKRKNENFFSNGMYKKYSIKTKEIEQKYKNLPVQLKPKADALLVKILKLQEKFLELNDN